MDQELFELCKEVYERTDLVGDAIWPDGEYRTPLYTSDYLLEKLPNQIEKDGVFYELIMRLPLDDYRFHYWSDAKRERLLTDNLGSGFVAVSNTPLKALLKLTLALHEAGELS